MRLSAHDLLFLTCPEAEVISYACMQRLLIFRKACQKEIAPLLAAEHWILEGSSKNLTLPWVRSIEIPANDTNALFGIQAPPHDAFDFGTLLAVKQPMRTECCAETTLCLEKKTRAHPPTVNNAKEQVRSWWVNYMREIGLVLLDVHKTGINHARLEEVFLKATAVAVACPSCRSHALKEFRPFENLLRYNIDEVIKKVSEFSLQHR